jgi:general secretion pathway protein D
MSEAFVQSSMCRNHVMHHARVRSRATLLVLAATASLASVSIATRSHAQQATTQDGRISLNFANARLRDVIQSLSQTLGITVVLTDVPDRRVSFTSTSPMSPADVGGVLESILESNGLVLVQRGQVAQVLPVERAPATGQLRIGLDTTGATTVGLVTQLVPLQFIRADEGAAALRQIASATARIEPVPNSNALLITDRGANVARYLQLLRKLDERSEGESGLRTYVVNLKYASADDLASAIGQLYGINVAGQRTGSLADRSLGRALDVFRQRETDAYSLRRDLPLTSGMSASAATSPTRDTSRGPTAPGALVGQTTIVASLPTNSLIIRTSPPNYPLLRQTIDALDTRPSQVLFEVTVAEVGLGRGSEYGIDWSTLAAGARAQSEAAIGSTTDASTGPGELALRLVTLRGTDVRSVLRVVATTSDVRVLSTPAILAMNNREAVINVGSKVPFIASTRLGNDIAIDRTVQYQDVGTKLTILPTINEDDYVSVQILQEVSSLTTQTISSALNAPVISTREASTRAVLRDGQTVVIGGLIGDSRTVTDRGVPFLKDVPMLGYLFKRQSVTRQRTELAIFVTPYLVRSDAEADAIRERARKRLDDRAPGVLDDTPVRAPRNPSAKPRER